MDRRKTRRTARNLAAQLTEVQARLAKAEEALKSMRAKEEALQADATKYRTIFEHMPEEVHFWQLVRNAEGQIKTWRLVDCNPPSLRSWGRKSTAEVRGKTTDEIFGPGATEHFMPVVRKVMSDGVPFSFEDYFPNLNKHFRFTSVPLGEFFITTGTDITDLKNTREELHAVEALQSSLLDGLPAGVMIIDPQTRRIENVNPHAAAMFGASAEQILGQRCHSFVCPALEGACPICDQGKKVDNAEREMLRADGLRIPILKSVKRIKIQGAERLLECFVDISQRKQAEAALRESQLRFSTIFHTSPVAIGISRLRDGHFLDVNEAFVRLYGYSRQEVIGHTSTELGLWHSSYRDSVIAQLREKKHFQIVDVQGRRKNGEICDLLASVELIELEGEPCIFGILTDITQRNRAQEALRQSEQRYRLLFDRNPDGVFSLDIAGHIIDANPACETISGYPQAELTQKTFMQLCAPDQLATVIERFQHALRDRVYTQLETALIRKDGRRVEVWITGEGIISSNKVTALHCTVKDITDHKRAEQDRIILSKLESTGILAGGIAHDFNNLLQAILLNIEMIDSKARAGQDVKFFIESARQSTSAAQSLTKQLIAFAQGGTPVRKPVRVHELVRASTLVALSGSTIRADISLDDDLLWTEADEGQLGQVIRNLVLNARDAMPAGGIVEIRAKNAILSADEVPNLAPGSYILLAVVDHGCGISPEALPRIFDPYFSTKKRGTDKGMGLGLTICHTIVKNHGGAILVKSQPQIGTIFQVYLPACKQPDAALRKYGPGPKPAHSARQQKILVMDDEDCMRVAIGSVLQGRGFQVCLTRDGNEAVARYSNAMSQGSPFDAVILDLTIRGGMGGKETMAALLNIDPAAKGIVISGYSEAPALASPEQYGFKAGIEKSFDVNQLIRMIAQITAS